MKTLGLIGGTTWLSTADYYRIINKQINERLGGLNSARLLLYSVNFQEFQPPVNPEGWIDFAERFTNIAFKLENAGAEGLVICANTPHLIADLIREKINIPLIHIAEETALEIKSRKVTKVGLLGTKFTMEQQFFKKKLHDAGISVLIPEENEREFIHATIFNELGRDIFLEKTRMRYLNIINEMAEHGAEGVIFGCTEIPLLIKDEQSSIPVFNTTLIHAAAAVNFALQ